jgi:DNA-binding response OmpR family regulator
MILLVERNAANRRLLRQVLEKEGYGVSEAGSVQEMEKVLGEGLPLRLALIDLAGLDTGIWPLCDELRKRNVPFFVLSPRQSRQVEAASYAHGARGVMVKPLVMQQLLATVKVLLEDA